MFKRFTCMILSLMLLASLVPAAAVTASAASRSTSDAAITILKKLETFVDHCDGNGFTGYGTKCTEKGAHGAHDIRETEADVALRAALKNLDQAINSFAANKGISLSQHQHDALVMFSYENGTAWTQGSDDLQTAVVSGVSGRDFVNVMRKWKSSDSDNTRRDIESNMYLFDKYNTSASSLETNLKNAGKTDNDDADDLVNDERVKVTVTNDYINVRAEASIYAAKVGTVYKGDVLRITTVKEANGYRWGRYVDSSYDKIGYVALMYTNYDALVAADKYEEEAKEEATKVVGTATVNVNGYVNVRSGAGTFNGIISSLRNGTKVDLYEIKYVNGQKWGRCDAGWFSLAYAKDLKVTDKSEVQTNDYEYQNFVFSGKLKSGGSIYKSMSTSASTVSLTSKEQDATWTISDITADSSGNTWGKTSKGWVLLTNDLGNTEDVTLNTAKFTTVASTSVRDWFETSAGLVTNLAKGTEFNVKLIVADKETIWGYTEKSGDMKYDGWVNLSTKYVSRNGAKIEEVKPESQEECDLATVVNCAEVKIRKDANIFSTQVGTLPAGTTVEVLEGPKNGTRTTGWYKVDVKNSKGTESWIRGDYLNVFEGTKGQINYGTTPTSPDGTKAATGRGMVANTYGGVNVRTAPGTANAQITKLLPGTVVDILEVTNYGSTKWGRIEQGWLCMDYIAMMDYDDVPAGGTGSTSTSTTSTKAVYTGKANDSLDVYKDTKVVDTNLVRTLKKGSAITVYEIKTVKEVTTDTSDVTVTEKFTWARINDGYVLIPNEGIAADLKMDTLDEVVYTVTGTDLLKVRTDAGTDNAREDRDLKRGEQVKVTEIKIADGAFWGKIEGDDMEAGADDAGWICLSYCTKGAVASAAPDAGSGNGGSNGGSAPAVTPTTMSTGNTGKCNYSGKIIGSAQVQEVNVRKEPTTGSAEVTSLKKGTAITITETRLVDGRSWGYCGSGWINLLYVDLTPVGITAIDAKVIANDNTLVYESSETGADVVGSYANRAVVNIYEEMNGMYKTDMGWVAKGNFL